MLEHLEETLCEYIADSRVCIITYKGKTFLAELYLLFRAKSGDLYVHGWKISGEYEKTVPPHWMQLRCEWIENIVGTKETFIAPMKGYHPKSRAFHKVLFEWKKR